ncbi:MAG: hypothetical protein ND866_29640 [Pyrinomonadaceae bacterium]|nr:hypothetical protein [Pyrinomonadaceae bacterium]
MEHIKFTAPAALALLTLLCTWQARRLLCKYDLEKLTLPDSAAKALEARERRWRTYAHVCASVCLAPVPFLLLLPVAEATDFAAKSFGAGAVAGAAVALLKLLPKVKFSKLFVYRVTH